MNDIWTTVATTGIGSAITAFITWFFTRKQYEEGVNAQKVQNFDAAIEAYKKMYEDMIGDLKEQVEDLKAENSSLKDELSETRKQVITLTNFVLASAMQRTDHTISQESVDKLKDILE